MANTNLKHQCDILDAAEAVRVVLAASNVTIYMINNPEWQAQFNVRPLWQQLLFAKLALTRPLNDPVILKLTQSPFFVQFLQKKGLKQALRMAGVM